MTSSLNSPVSDLSPTNLVPPQYTPVPSVVPGLSPHTLDLNGVWKFTEKAPEVFRPLESVDAWSDIQVPGEWFMQGFDVAKTDAAGYARFFEVPEAWAGQRLKLLFDGVYSDSEVFVNGTKVGAHVGGFTPFECDVTDAVGVGETNQVTLKVKNDSLADSLASGSSYACHPLGGITRNVRLFAVPEVHVSDLTIQTRFDEAFRDAELTVKVRVRNQSDISVTNATLQCEVREVGEGQPVLCTLEALVPTLDSGEERDVMLQASVSNPKLWHCEHPHLHGCRTRLRVNDACVEELETRFGFRQVDVVGNQLLVNGKPVNLRGVNRHEVHPLHGRAYVPGLAWKDVALFREANVNHIRTCHYPPSRELLEACDELGMFLEVEAPFCWAHETEAASEALRPATVLPNLETVQRDKNHPSVIFWSLGNESHWNEHFAAAGEAVAALDPTRPRTFNYYPWGVVYHFQDEPFCPIATDHYPGYLGAQKFADHHRPVSFGEFGHLNAYNRFELATDQGLRDRWGEFFHRLWEGMFHAKGCAGGSIWAGIDDTFYVRGMTLGYGTWGPIDGWRRPKPEYWAVKMTYAPVQLISVEQAEQVTLVLENRQDASNLSRFALHWSCGGKAGDLRAEAPPRERTTVVLPAKPLPDAPLYVEVLDPRGFTVNQFVIEAEDAMETVREEEVLHLEETPEAVILRGSRCEYEIDKRTGQFSRMQVNGESFTISGPHLMVLPLNSGGVTRMEINDQPIETTPFTETCTEWKLSRVQIREWDGAYEVYVFGVYTEALGTFVYRFLKDGTFTVTTDFQMKQELNPRQIGVVFDLPKDFSTLSWHRDGQWDRYPEWHIGRTRGTAKAEEGVEVTCVGPATEPAHEWRHDRSALGCHDFTATKHKIRHASLSTDAGIGLRVLAEGDRHARAWIGEGVHRLLIAHYSNGGSERFLQWLCKQEQQALCKNDRVFSVARFELYKETTV